MSDADHRGKWRNTTPDNGLRGRGMWPAFLMGARTACGVSGGRARHPAWRRGIPSAEGAPVADQSGKSGAPREEFQEGKAAKGAAGPSSNTDDRGLEGSILEGDAGRTS